MFWSFSALVGYPIKATDGQLGTVVSFLYEPSDWSIRWLIIDTGGWLSGRRTLLPISALGQPDPKAHHLPVNLTMKQVESSPEIDDGEPLSEDTELLVCEHYNLSQRDGRIPGDRDGKTPPDQAAVATREVRNHDCGLRNIADIIGFSIEANDGEIGHAEDFLIDIERWQISYLMVHSSTWWTDDKRLISPLSIEGIDSARSIIHLDVACQKVKDSPRYVPSETVDGAFDELFHSYYGLRWIRK